MRNFWAVGACFDGVHDKSEEFINKSEWYDGYAAENDNRYLNLLNEVQVKDVLILKSKAVKGKKIPFTRLKAIGFIQKKRNYFTFEVKWITDPDNFPIDFDGILYMKTIGKMRNDKLLEYVTNYLDGI
jgi:hypothetical protein